MQTAAVRAPIVASAQQQKAAPKATVAALPRVAKALGAGVASLALALSANAATVKRECSLATCNAQLARHSSHRGPPCPSQGAAGPETGEWWGIKRLTPPPSPPCCSGR